MLIGHSIGAVVAQKCAQRFELAGWPVVAERILGWLAAGHASADAGG